MFKKQNKSMLDEIKIASPCSASWDDMVGDEKVKFCSSCNKNVYNLSSLSKNEAENLLRVTENKICIRLYRRADGTVINDDCPVAIRIIKQAYFKASATIAAAISILFAFSLPAKSGNENSNNTKCSKSKTPNTQNMQPLMGTPPPAVTMGEISIPQASPPEKWMDNYKKKMIQMILAKLPKDSEIAKSEWLISLDRSGKICMRQALSPSSDESTNNTIIKILADTQFMPLPKEFKENIVTLNIVIAKENSK